jgi:hypothetical protein
VVELEAARTLAERFLVVIMQAVRAGQITPGQAGLVYGARAQGLAASEAGRRLGLAPGAVYYALAQAERALGRAVA